MGVVAQAVVMFAVTNVDDALLLALYFGQAGGDRRTERGIVVGQYLGFGAIMAVSLLSAFGLGLLPEGATAYLGLVPLALGLRAAVAAWRERGDGGGRHPGPPTARPALGSGHIAAVTFSNGGDNIGVYVPVFVAGGTAVVAGYTVVFLAMVALWCALGRYVASRPSVARVLARWGHVLLPVVLVAVGMLILVEGGAFGW